MDWAYHIDVEKLGTGAWHSDIGRVELVRPELKYQGWVYLHGKSIKVNDSQSLDKLWESAEAAMKGVERVYEREMGKR